MELNSGVASNQCVESIIENYGQKLLFITISEYLTGLEVHLMLITLEPEVMSQFNREIPLMKNFGSAPTSSHLCYYNSLSTY
jgi:hypothetical protein